METETANAPTDQSPEYWKDAVEKHFPAVVAQRESLLVEPKPEWKVLFDRRMQDRMEAMNSNKKSDRKKKETNQKGPVDKDCGAKLDPDKYGFYIETEGELQGLDVKTKPSFYIETCQTATNTDDGDFVLYLNVPDFFSSSDEESSFEYYFGEGKKYFQVCEGIEHYAKVPCPIRIYVTHKETGLQAELFDSSFGRLWLYDCFASYDDETKILPILMDAEKDTMPIDGRILHIYNKCERLELNGNEKHYGSMGIALFRSGTTLAIRILIEGFSNKSAGQFFGELLKFR